MSDTEWVDYFNRKVTIDFWVDTQPNNENQNCTGVDDVGMSDLYCHNDNRKVHAVCELPKIN